MSSYTGAGQFTRSDDVGCISDQVEAWAMSYVGCRLWLLALRPFSRRPFYVGYNASLPNGTNRLFDASLETTQRSLGIDNDV